jgi:hypothetical protein
MNSPPPPQPTPHSTGTGVGWETLLLLDMAEAEGTLNNLESAGRGGNSAKVRNQMQNLKPILHWKFFGFELNSKESVKVTFFSYIHSIY